MEEEQSKENILPSTKSINMMELLPRLLSKEEKDFKITPSEYVKEMSLSMEERYKKSVHITNNMKGLSKTYPPEFKIVPDILVFQRFEIRSTNVLILTVKNVGKSLLPIKMHCPSSDYFSAHFANTPSMKIAPGLGVEYKVTFTPNELKDQSHFLLFSSRDKLFRVPIIAIGPRPILDIPDQIVLNPAPVKIPTNKFIVIRNIGTAPAVFNFITQSKHFKVSPAKGILAVQESMVLDISFESSKVKEVTELLQLALETEEKLTITLHGSAENVCVRLDKTSLVHEDTFIGLKRCKTIRLINSSPSVIKFSWKKNKTQEEDLNIIKSMRDKYEELTEMEILKNAKVIYYGLSNAEKHKLSCERILKDELRLLENEEFKFSHEEFKIMPENGEVWPKGSVELMVSFEPKSCGIITTEAYLEVSGKDSRLPLKIKGNGIGPNIAFNTKILDIDFVYLCSLHKYEVVVENKGDIPGTIKYIPEPLVFGGKADVAPNSVHLEPGHVESFFISFTSNRMGDFTEKFSFVIQESEEKLYLLLKGKVMVPSLQFDVKEISFGTVPFGFPKSQEITLNNLSVVPVLFSLKVKPDGDVPSISYDQFAKFTVKPDLPTSPKEFKMNPEESVVEPFSNKKITVTLTPNKTGSFQKQLIVDMWNSENGAAFCSIVYKALAPEVVSEPQTIYNSFCIINYPFTRSISIRNTSEVDGFFYIVPTDPNNKTSITCSVNIPQGIIQPEELVKIDLSVITSALGLQVSPLNMLVFGYKNPQKICEITCLCQGPVVRIKPTSLNWGELPLIQPSEKTLVLSNESPIPAVVKLQMNKQNSHWSVNPSDLKIPSGNTVEVVIRLILTDRGKFKDNLKIDVHNGKDLLVPVTATGVGSSLIIKPELSPYYDLGMLSSHKAYEFEIVIDNKGTKLSSLFWSPTGDFKVFANAKFVYPPDLLFKFEPSKLDIQPGEQATVILQTFSKSPGKFSQLFYCFSSIGNLNKTLFFKFEVRAKFLEPVVCFDKTEVRFWHNVGYNEVEDKLKDNVCVINNSLLPVPIELTATDPFYIETPLGEYTQTLELNLDEMEVKPLVLKFFSQPNPYKVCTTCKGKLTAVLKNFPKLITVCLIGEVNYPNVIAQPNIVDFGYIVRGRNYTRTISLINVSPLTVHFSITWDAVSSKAKYSHKALFEEQQTSGKTFEEASQNGECDIEESIEEDKRQEEEGNDISADVKSQLSLNAPVKPVLKMPEIEISSSDIRRALFPLSRKYFSCDNELMEAYRLASSSKFERADCDTSFPRVCNIIPFYGELEPYGSQTLIIQFLTKFALNAHLKAFIKVLCGPTETITIDAITTEIDIQLNSYELDFGRQLFCETTNQTLKVHNPSSMTLPFQTNSELKSAVNEKSVSKRGLMTVSPESGDMPSNQSTELIVQYHPGVPGYFESYLELQIAFLEPVLVKLKGTGVFPQVYVTLPRPDIFAVPSDICYKAIASITPDWVLTKFFQIGSCGYDLVNFCRNQEEEIEVDLSEENEWEILDCFDSVPTEVDIYLAIERGIAYDLLQQENSVAYAAYARTIPGFVVPAYTLDFGVCMIGLKYEQQVVVVNYGPLPVILYGVFSSKLKEQGIIIRLKKRNEIKVGACLPFIVSFEPMKSNYSQKNERLDVLFHFEVHHGPKIPVRIISEVSYPYIIASMPVMEFCEVVCGCCKIMELRLYNPGVMPAFWDAYIRLDDKENQDAKSSRGRCQRSMFQVQQKTGTLLSGDYCTLSISFKPEFEGYFSSVLNIAVDKSLMDLKILMVGSGIEPRLCVSKCILNFKPILPFPNKSVLTEKIFFVENLCSFPIEFYFEDLDEQILEEDKIIRALTLYYNTDECLIPVRRSGEGLPSEIVDFYNMLLDSLNSKYMEEERGKILAERDRESLEENVSSNMFPEDDLLLETGQIIERKKKKFKKPSRSRTSMESSRDLIGSMTSIREPIVLTMFETKTADEIDEMLEDYIKYIRNTEPRYDPLKDSLKNMSEPQKEKEYKEGTLIIIHGAPYTNSPQLANQVANFLNMPALNIDRIVLEEAVLERCDAGLLAKELIERAYLDQFGVEVKENEKDRKEEEGEEEEEEEGEAVHPPFAQGFEEIQRKFKALKDLRENLSSARGMNNRTPSTISGTPRKAEKEKTHFKPPVNVNVPVANITEEIVTEILKYRIGLEVCKGVIIEKLENSFINTCTNALITILKAAGNVEDIIVIFFLTNYFSYQKLITKKREEEELMNLLLQQEILRILEEEPEEVFEALNISPEKSEFCRMIFIRERLEAQIKFEKKREDFYESLRQKKKGPLINMISSNAPDTSTPLPSKKTKESENISKKTKTSERSGRKPQSEPKSAAKINPDPIDFEFESFEISFTEMKRIIENWDQRIGLDTVESQQDIKTKKTQSPRRVSSTPISKEDSRGVFLWLVDVSKPLNQNVLACCSHLKETLQKRKPPEEYESWPLYCTKSMTFSVVSAPKKRLRCPLQQIFTIKATEYVMMGEDYCEDMGECRAAIPFANTKLNRSASSISFKSKRKSSGTKRGRADSRISMDSKTKKTISASVQENQFKTRWILQPGEVQHYLVRYYPTQVGCWEQQYCLSIVNFSQAYTIRCFGYCDIPRLDMDPKILFGRVEYERPVQKESIPAFYYLEKIYDFGAVITTQLNEEKKSSEKSVSLSLRNISSLPVDLNVILGDSKATDEGNGSEFVKIFPDKLWINPNESELLTITVSPTRNGLFLETLLFIIKDNPKVESLQIKFEGVKSKVFVQPELLDFDRILLHRTDYRNLVLVNENTLPLRFQLIVTEEFPKNVDFSEKCGIIYPLDYITIKVSYKAVEVEVIDRKPMLVQIFDDAEGKNMVQELTFEIKAEAYDTALDIIFSASEDDHINFGDIRTDTNYGNEFSLKNCGKYQLGYKIIINEKFLNEIEFLHITPMEGKLIPGKLHQISTTIKLQHEVSWNRLEFFKIYLVEPFQADENIAAIPLNLTVRSHFARFNLQPSDQYNFGHIIVGPPKTGTLQLINTGFFSLLFSIEALNPLVTTEMSGGDTKKSAKFSASSKDKVEKGKKNDGVLKVGNFEISPSIGTVGPGLTLPINITCSPNEVKNYEEQVVVLVNESPPHLQKGRLLTITAESCLPFVDFEDYKNIFREHFCCEDENDLNARCKAGYYTLYTIKDNFFSFKNNCVNKKTEARLHFENPGPIDCVLTAAVSLEPQEGNGGLPSNDSQIFSVSPEKHIIEAYNSACFLISFTPNALEVYEGKLTFKLVRPEGFDDIVHVYNLWGNGILPQIEITEPILKTPEGQTLVNFPPVSPGRSCCSTIAFTNVGVSNCKVVMELFKFQNGIFTITPKSESESTLKAWELAKAIDHTALVSLAPGQVAEFYVTFAPQEVQNYNSLIKLFVVDNPFENWCFKLNGEVYLEEVIIEKIRTASPFLTHTDENSLGVISLNQYFINLGDCYVKKKSKVVFRLTNRTDKSYFKFEWEEVPSISITPNVGHLYPNSYKEILVVFCPEEPMEVDDITLMCLLSKIVIKTPPELSWDSRQSQNDSDTSSHTSRTHDKNSSVATVTDEPFHEIIPESNLNLYVIMSAIADYARLTCEATKIIFKETFMFQTRKYPLVLINSGNVALEYKVSLKSVTSLPLKDSKGAQVNEPSLQRPSNRPLSRWSSFSSSHRRNLPQPCESPKDSSPLDLSSLDAECEDDTPFECNFFGYNPFSIENPMGRILAREEATVNIVFSPMDINEYRAILTIQVANLHPENQLPEIQITATSIMPFCHFEIAESDYLKSGRRDHNRPGPVGFAPGVPLHPETKTIETKVVGLDVVTLIKFHVINPTEEDYAFSWTNTTQIQPGVVSPFLCSTTDGQIQAGRQQLMSFNFVSQNIGISESFWTFRIPKFGIETPFLFVGDVREPAVYLLSNHICMTPTFIDCSTSDTVILASQEDEPIDFHFVTDSLYSEGRLNVLNVDPLSGTILPQSEFTVRLKFCGKTPGKSLFNAKCKIKNLKNPLTISVEVVTFAVQYILTLENSKGKSHPEFNERNFLEFSSEMSTNVPESMTLTITNFAKTPLYYEWEYNLDLLETRPCKLKFSPKSGHIEPLQKEICDITLVFLKKSFLCEFPVMLKLHLGPTINFFVSGTAAVPHWEFSFTFYDFGFCFLQEKDICYNTTSLFIANRDLTELCLECKLPDSSAFACSVGNIVIYPCECMEIPLTFSPKETICYEDVLKLTLNGHHTKNIRLMGHGTEFKVTLVNAEDKTILLGAVREGQMSSRKFSIVNKSLAEATLLIGFSDQLPVSGEFLAEPGKYFVDKSAYHRLPKKITITPSAVFKIKPQEEQTVCVTYTPSSRELPFSETLYLQHQEVTEPLCVLTGCCLGPDFWLDRNFLNFGGIIEGCTTSLKLKLVNSGDFGARFEWGVKNLKDYSISPACGYSSSQSHVTITVTFHPTQIQSCIKESVICQLHLSNTEYYPPLNLSLIGDCVAVPDPQEIILFECIVRKKAEEFVEIENSSGTEWQLLPVVTGDYFSGEETIVISPLSSANYQVNYHPMTMTLSEETHQGTVFFKLPNGRAIVYMMKGVALPPEPEEIIKREVPCKTKYVELLKVNNWLQFPQRFKVDINCVDDCDPATSCTGFEYLEVPGLAQKEYSLNFFAFNVGLYNYNVKFINEETKEYIWYVIDWNVVMCGPLEVITLRSGVRQTCTHELKLENPLKKTIEYELETTTPEIYFDSPTYEVPPEQSIYVVLSFTPIHPGEKNEKLTASCPELGIFPRELRLFASEVLPEPPRTFQTPLGTSLKQEFSITNHSWETAILHCNVDSDDFTVAEQSTVPEGQTKKITVTFEPSDLGSTTATLFIQSNQAGKFIFPLVGMGTKPLAKGPFSLKPGSGVTIIFKNVFKKPKEFHMYVDNPAFILKTTQETLSPKEESKIFVGMQKMKRLEKEYVDWEKKPNFPVTGQLVVECFNPYIRWQFYLKGSLDS